VRTVTVTPTNGANGKAVVANRFFLVWLSPSAGRPGTAIVRAAPAPRSCEPKRRREPAN